MAAAPPAGQPDYGLDSPILARSMFSRGGWTLAAGLAVWFVNRTEYPGPAAALFGVLGAIALVFFGIGGFMIWSSRVGKLRVRDQLLDALELAGTEKILDAGCGRGQAVEERTRHRRRCMEPAGPFGQLGRRRQGKREDRGRRRARALRNLRS